MSVLEIRDLHVRFRLPAGGHLHAVRGLSLVLDSGQRLGLVGESGCGKSTVLMAVMGLLPSTATVSGAILVDGDDILADGERSTRRHRWTDVAMVFQGTMNAFNPVRTIGSQVAEPLRVHRLAARSAARRRAQELLDMVGLPSAGGRFAHQLSGGMRQRAALAMALSCRPRVLLADEPTTALDVLVQAQIMDLLVDLTAGERLALLLVSHDLELVSQVCERLAIMWAGGIVEMGDAGMLRRAPHHAYTARLLSAIGELGATDLRSRTTSTIGGDGDGTAHGG